MIVCGVIALIAGLAVSESSGGAIFASFLISLILNGFVTLLFKDALTGGWEYAAGIGVGLLAFAAGAAGATGFIDDIFDSF